MIPNTVIRIIRIRAVGVLPGGITLLPGIHVGVVEDLVAWVMVVLGLKGHVGDDVVAVDYAVQGGQL